MYWNPDMHSRFLSKVPVNEPIQVPQQCPMERAAPQQCPMERPAHLQVFFFNISLKFHIKIPLNKINYPFSQRPWESVAPFSAKAGPCGNRCPFPEPITGENNYLFGR